MLYHTTRRCSFGEPMTLTRENGITTRFYGTWILAEVNGSTLFVNLEVNSNILVNIKEDHQWGITIKEANNEQEKALESRKQCFDESPNSRL